MHRRLDSLRSTESVAVPLALRQAVRAADLLEGLPIGVYICDRDGLVVQYNRRAAELWGREPEPGDPHERFCGSHRLFLPDGRRLPHAETPMARVLRTGDAARDETVIVERPDGTRLTVLVNIDPLYDDDGLMAGAVNCFQDISELKRAQDRLSERERWYRDLLEALPAAIYTTDAEGRFEFGLLLAQGEALLHLVEALLAEVAHAQQLVVVERHQLPDLGDVVALQAVVGAHREVEVLDGQVEVGRAGVGHGQIEHVENIVSKHHLPNHETLRKRRDNSQQVVQIDCRHHLPLQVKEPLGKASFEVFRQIDGPHARMVISCPVTASNTSLSVNHVAVLPGVRRPEVLRLHAIVRAAVRDNDAQVRIDRHSASSCRVS
jgi:PAS domain S-box-containing protein